VAGETRIAGQRLDEDDEQDDDAEGDAGEPA
jgi:hypothetical protein